MILDVLDVICIFGSGFFFAGTIANLFSENGTWQGALFFAFLSAFLLIAGLS